MAGFARCAFVEDMTELLLGPFLLAAGLQIGPHLTLQFDEQFHIQCRIVAPVTRQRPVRPVGCGMLFGERDAQIPFGDGRQAETAQPEHARRHFGVEQALRCHADLCKARKVHHGVVNNPRRIAHRTVEPAPIGSGGSQRDRVEQEDSRPLAFELHQPILMPIAESRSPFGVGRQGPGCRGKLIACVVEPFHGVDHIGHSPAWFGLQPWLMHNFAQRVILLHRERWILEIRPMSPHRHRGRIRMRVGSPACRRHVSHSLQTYQHPANQTPCSA